MSSKLFTILYNIMHSLIHDIVYNDKHRAATEQPSPHRRAYNAAAKELKKMKDVVMEFIACVIWAMFSAFIIYGYFCK